MNDEIKPNKAYSTLDVQKITGLPQITIVNEINNGNLKGKRIGRVWRIFGSNLQEYISTPTIAPPLKKSHGKADRDSQLELDEKEVSKT